MRRSGRMARVSSTSALMVAAERASRLPWARVISAGAVMAIRPPSCSCVGRRCPRRCCVGVGVRSLVDPALGLLGAGPAAAARVLARRDALGAGPAPDGGVAVVLQGVD